MRYVEQLIVFLRMFKHLFIWVVVGLFFNSMVISTELQATKQKQTENQDYLHTQCLAWLNSAESQGFRTHLKAGRKPSFGSNQSCILALLREMVEQELNLDDSQYGKSDIVVPFSPSSLCGKMTEIFPNVKCTVQLILSGVEPALGFAALRKADKVIDSIRRSFSLVEGSPALIPLNPGAGKSGSTFVQTADKNFILKDVATSEVDNLGKLMRGSAKVSPLRQHFVDNRNSLLNRIYGAYKVNLFSESWTYILMADAKHGLRMSDGTSDSQSSCYVLSYDLKGKSRKKGGANWSQCSTSDVDACKIGKTGVNGDFVSQEKSRVHLEPKRCLQLRNALRLDTELLQKHNLIDYSLLVTRQNGSCQSSCSIGSRLCLGSTNPGEQYSVSVIDYLIYFGAKKQAESFLKGGKFSNYAGKINKFFDSICPIK